jgi:hypothetical protein
MTELPHLPEIFDTLRGGYHYTPSDGEVFRALWTHFDAYRDAFDAFGLNLRKHPRRVVYLASGDEQDPGKQAREMGLFMLILVQWMGEHEGSIDPDLFEKTFFVDTLPHLQSNRYKEYMKAVDIHDSGGLESVVGTLIRLGFAEKSGQGFRFRNAAYRFLDLCLDALDLDASSSDGVAPHDASSTARP